MVSVRLSDLHEDVQEMIKEKPMYSIMVIARKKDSKDKGEKKYGNVLETKVPLIPQIGEHIAIMPDQGAWYKVVGIVRLLSKNGQDGLVEVWVDYSGLQEEVQDRFFD